MVVFGLESDRKKQAQSSSFYTKATKKAAAVKKAAASKKAALGAKQVKKNT